MICLRTSAQRAVESSLLIDETFLHVALAARHLHPELLFGGREFAGHLNARALVRAHGDKALSVPFMTDMHRALSRFTNPEHGGVLSRRIRWAPQLEALTDREIAVVESNRFLKFLPPGTVPTLHGGVEYRLRSPAAVRGELLSLSQWYNSSRGQPGADPYPIAAELQQRFVSIHPWNHDYNGRSSRVLMNWALEREGLPPSAIRDFDRDIFTTTDEWTDRVREGSQLFADRANRLERLGPDTDPITVFGLEHERQRFLTLNPEPPSFVPGALHDVNAFRSLLTQLRSNEP